jgi:acyl-CoA dehydrogenase
MPPLEDFPIARRDPEDVAAKAQEGIFMWRCRICGNIHYGEEPPVECPFCFFPNTAFKKIGPQGLAASGECP